MYIYPWILISISPSGSLLIIEFRSCHISFLWGTYHTLYTFNFQKFLVYIFFPFISKVSALDWLIPAGLKNVSLPLLLLPFWWNASACSLKLHHFFVPLGPPHTLGKDCGPSTAALGTRADYWLHLWGESLWKPGSTKKKSQVITLKPRSISFIFSSNRAKYAKSNFFFVNYTFPGVLVCFWRKRRGEQNPQVLLLLLTLS